MSYLLVAYVVVTSILGGMYYHELQFNHWWTGFLGGFGIGSAFYFIVVVPLCELLCDIEILYEENHLLRNNGERIK